MSIGSVASQIPLKIVVVGDRETGKTSVLQKNIHDRICQNYKPTIGVNFFLKAMTHATRGPVSIQLWDISGESLWNTSDAHGGNLFQMCLQNADGAIVLCDRTRRSTFDSVSRCKERIEKCRGQQIPTILLANKRDITDAPPVMLEEASARALELGMIGCYETSAKDGTGIEEAINALVIQLLGE